MNNHLIFNRQYEIFKWKRYTEFLNRLSRAAFAFILSDVRLSAHSITIARKAKLQASQTKLVNYRKFGVFLIAESYMKPY